MPIIARSAISLGPRQRTKMDSTALRELQDSILAAAGLLHPPIVHRTGVDTYALVCGGRRLAAIDAIAKEALPFTCGAETILPGEVPVLILSELGPAELASAELEENILREDISWQERCRAITAIHELRKTQNPEQTVRETATEIRKRTGNDGASDGGTRQAVQESLIVAQHLDDPKIAAAKSRSEAMTLIRTREETRWQQELVRRRTEQLASEGKQDPLCRVIQGDLTEQLPLLDPESVDLFLFDPPYGQQADGAGYATRSAVGGHQYDDSPEAALKLMLIILGQSCRIAKPRSNFFMFFHIDNWLWIRDHAIECGWTPFPTPLIWVKSDTEGLAPWGRTGVRRTTEFIFFATRGQRGLVQSPVDVFRNNRVSRSSRTHAAEKPVGLLTDLILCSTIVGDMVLDPTCGSGSTMEAARTTRRRAIGIELDPDMARLATIRAAGDESVPEEAASAISDL